MSHHTYADEMLTLSGVDSDKKLVRTKKRSTMFKELREVKRLLDKGKGAIDLRKRDELYGILQALSWVLDLDAMRPSKGAML